MGQRFDIEILTDFLKKYPNATLEEGVNEYNRLVAKEKQEQIEKEIAEQKYFESLIGKCFTIDFNGYSKMFFKVKEIGTNCILTEQTYDIYKKGDNIKIETNDRVLNKLWFDNPYKNAILHDVNAVEITEEKFNELIKLIEGFKTINQKVFNLL